MLALALALAMALALALALVLANSSRNLKENRSWRNVPQHAPYGPIHRSGSDRVSCAFPCTYPPKSPCAPGLAGLLRVTQSAVLIAQNILGLPMTWEHFCLTSDPHPAEAPCKPWYCFFLCSSFYYAPSSN